MADFRFLVEDVVTGQIKTADCRLSDWACGDILNRPGSLTASIGLTDPDANEEVLSAWRTAIYMERNGRIEWGGILLPPRLEVGGTALSLGCVGWLGYWDRRTIRTTYQPSAVDQFTIFAKLIADAQDEAVFGDGWNLGISVTWDALSGVLRDRLEDYRDFQSKNLGEALRQLAALEGGFDFSMVYTVNATTDRIDKEIRLHHPRKGRDTGYQFTYDRESAGGNVIARGFADPVDLAWSGDGWGAGSDAARLKTPYVDASLRNVYPPFDAAPTWASVIEQTTLDANTEQWFRTRHLPRPTPVLRVDPDRYPLWGDWGTGDTILANITDGYGSTGGPQLNRITGWNITDSGATHDLILGDPDYELST